MATHKRKINVAFTHEEEEKASPIIPARRPNDQNVNRKIVRDYTNNMKMALLRTIIIIIVYKKNKNSERQYDTYHSRTECPRHKNDVLIR